MFSRDTSVDAVGPTVLSFQQLSSRFVKSGVGRLWPREFGLFGIKVFSDFSSPPFSGRYLLCQILIILASALEIFSLRVNAGTSEEYGSSGRIRETHYAVDGSKSAEMIYDFSFQGCYTNWSCVVVLESQELFGALSAVVKSTNNLPTPRADYFWASGNVHEFRVIESIKQIAKENRMKVAGGAVIGIGPTPYATSTPIIPLWYAFASGPYLHESSGKCLPLFALSDHRHYAEDAKVSFFATQGKSYPYLVRSMSTLTDYSFLSKFRTKDFERYGVYTNAVLTNQLTVRSGRELIQAAKLTFMSPTNYIPTAAQLLLVEYDISVTNYLEQSVLAGQIEKYSVFPGKLLITDARVWQPGTRQTVSVLADRWPELHSSVQLRQRKEAVRSDFLELRILFTFGCVASLGVFFWLYRKLNVTKNERKEYATR